MQTTTRCQVNTGFTSVDAAHCGMDLWVGGKETLVAWLCCEMTKPRGGGEENGIEIKNWTVVLSSP